jgi:hypothetical protein
VDDQQPDANRPAERFVPTPSAHLLRFGAAMSLLVAVALTSVALEQRSLRLAREFSLQTFRADRLQRQIADLELRIEQLQTPQRLMDVTTAGVPPTRSAGFEVR